MGKQDNKGLSKEDHNFWSVVVAFALCCLPLPCITLASIKPLYPHAVGRKPR